MLKSVIYKASSFKKITKEHIGGVKPEPGKISRTERQWIQIEKAISGDKAPFILKEELKQEMDKTTMIQTLL